MDGVTSSTDDKGQGAELPEGFKTVDEFLEDMRDKFRAGVDADKENADAALDDLKFLAGDQWDAKVKAKRRNRPTLTINDLPQYIGQVIGDIRMNRPAIKFRPFEDTDQELADVRTGLVRSIENLSNATHVYALAGEDQVGCGVGHFRVGLEYTDDDAFDQDIRISHIPNPLAVVWDAYHTDITGADAGHCFVIDEIDPKLFKKAWPNATTTELSTSTSTSDWVNKDGVRVTEYWLMQATRRTIAFVQQAPEAQPAVIDITGREAEMAEFIVRDSTGRPQQREIQRREAWMYLTTGQEILDGPYKYPLNRLPIIKVTGREIRLPNKRYRFGLIRFAKDPQRMKNIWRSLAAEWLSMSPKQQYALHVADKDTADLLRQAVKSGDLILPYSGQNPPHRLDPPSAPNSLLQEAQLCAQDIKDVTGLHDASLGMRSNETSGKAIVARERQGDVATFMYHDNLKLSIVECGKVVDQLFPVAYDTARTLRIIGPDETAKVVRLNDPKNPQSIDIAKGKYDIVVDTGPSFSTKRVEAAESMAQAIQAMPIIGQVAADLFAEAQDWPMAEEIAKRLKKAMPPHLIQDDEDADPQAAAQRQAAEQAAQQQQAQAAQQAQQMAMEKAKLELAEQQAKTAQTQSQADKARADADKAKAEASLAIAQAAAAEAEARARVMAAQAQTFGPVVSSPPEFPPTDDGYPAA